MVSAATPRGRVSLRARRTRSSIQHSALAEAGDVGVAPVHVRSFQNLSTSPLPELEHMQEPGCSSTPILKCGPQAQSTPLTERFGGSITNKSQSSTRDSFDDLNDCVLPVIPPSHSPTRRSKEEKSDSTREGHNDSCGSMATLAEGAPLQCTTVRFPPS
ncbi:hypothetical protein COOONC_17165 [Cooperia oncophora]